MASKADKEAFVTGYNGTTPFELLLVCSSAPIGVWVLAKLGVSERKPLHIGLESVCLLLPMAICQTTLLYPWGIIVLLAEISTAAVLSLPLSLSLSSVQNSKKTHANATRRGFLSSYRSCVLYLTFVAILAVDFHVFPRRFAKTEVSGYGLMDLGAGSFVVAAGLVSKRKTINLKVSLTRLIPLLLLGGIRLATTKGLEYQEHVSEYGVHWNFFFTLAVLRPLGAMVPSSLGIPIVIMVVYQFLLTLGGVQDWIENSPRHCQEPSVLCDILVANREGVLGCIGYLSLFLAAEQVGRRCIWNGRVSLFLVAFGLWVLLGALQACGILVSRRSTNAAFCVWTLAHNVLLLASIEAAAPNSIQTPPILEAVNRHGLIVFVIANLLTGLVNLSFNTLEATDTEALLILFIYLCAIGVIALLASHIWKRKVD